MFPAQALAEVLLSAGWRVTLSTDERGASHAGGFPAEVDQQVVASGTFARGGLLAKLGVPFRVLSGVLAARARFRAEKPDVVVGFGGYPAIPAMGAAWLLGLPRMIHEQNGVLGRVNALFAPRVNRVACAVWPTALPKGVAGVHTGNPVRSAIREVAGAPYPAMDGALRVVAFGGSQGARIISNVVPAALGALPEVLRARLRVTHQAREEDGARVREAYASAGIEAEVTPFIGDMAERLTAAHLVIARSGASSVADVAAVGRPAIYVPLAIAIRDEQTANARPFVEAGAAMLMREADFTPEALSAKVAAILGDPETAAAMAAAAGALGRPDAAERLMAEVIDLAGKA